MMPSLAYIAASVVPSVSASSVHVMKMAAAFGESGLHTRLFCVPGALKADVYREYGVGEAFTIEYVARPGGAFGAASYSARVLSRLVEMNPDCVYGRHLPAITAAVMCGFPAAFEAHVVPDSTASRNLLRLFAAQPYCRGIVAISSALAADLRKILPDNARIVVAHDGADVPLVPAPTRRVWPRKVGYIGQLYPGKGIEVVTRLAASMPDVEFHVIGGTAEDIEYWRGEEGFSRIVWHGQSPHANVLRLAREFGILIAPYQRRVSVRGGKGDIARWMSPLKIFEYMAANVPMIVSDLPVIREVLENGRNALLAGPDDLQQWESAIRKLLGSPELSLALSQSAYADLTGKYSWTRRAEFIRNTVLNV